MEVTKKVHRGKLRVKPDVNIKRCRKLRLNVENSRNLKTRKREKKVAWSTMRIFWPQSFSSFSFVPHVHCPLGLVPLIFSLPLWLQAFSKLYYILLVSILCTFSYLSSSVLLIVSMFTSSPVQNTRKNKR